MSEHVFEVDFYPGNFYEHVFGVLSYFFIMGEAFFSYLTALLRLYHLPFINIINGEKGRGRYFTVVTFFTVCFAPCYL